MSADPRLDRIAASFEDALTRARPRTRAHFAAVTDRFIADQLNVFDGDPAELGAVFLNLYREASALRVEIGESATLTGLMLLLAHGGTDLYLRRHPAAQR